MSLTQLNSADEHRMRIPGTNATILTGIALLLLFAIAIHAASQSPGTMPDALASMVVFP